MSMYVPPGVDTDSDSTRTTLSRMGPIMTPLSPATQHDLLGILQREQDHAMSLLALSPLLSSLFISYANRVAALESAAPTPSPENEEWKTLQTTVARLREENERLESETREMAEKLEAAEASQEAFRSQVLSLKDVSTSQKDDIESLRTELSEVKDKYIRLMVDSNAEKAGLQVQVMELEAQRGELKETVVEQQIKISKLDRCMPSYYAPSPSTGPESPALGLTIPGSPILHVPPPLSGQGEVVPSSPLTPPPSSSTHGKNGPTGIHPPPLPRDGTIRPVPAVRRPQKPNYVVKGPSFNWIGTVGDDL